MKNKSKKCMRTIIILIIVLFVFINTPFYYPVRSYVVMSLYSNYEKNRSLLSKEGLEFNIPGGLYTNEKDWYPFVMVFNDDYGFSNYMNKDLSLTILYNFGAFDLKHGCSNFYNPDSKYYGSFYGGYIVKNNNDKRPYGFSKENKPDIDEITSVAKYDLNYLVLQSLGCTIDKIKMDYNVERLINNYEYLNYEGWTLLDTQINMNSPLHEYNDNKRAYIQYGLPKFKLTKDSFYKMEMKGRIFAKYFEKWDLTMFLYALAPDYDTINKCDKEILSKTILRKIKN